MLIRGTYYNSCIWGVSIALCFYYFVFLFFELLDRSLWLYSFACQSSVVYRAMYFLNFVLAFLYSCYTEQYTNQGLSSKQSEPTLCWEQDKLKIMYTSFDIRFYNFIGYVFCLFMVKLNDPVLKMSWRPNISDFWKTLAKFFWHFFCQFQSLYKIINIPPIFSFFFLSP